MIDTDMIVGIAIAASDDDDDDAAAAVYTTDHFFHFTYNAFNVSLRFVNN